MKKNKTISNLDNKWLESNKRQKQSPTIDDAPIKMGWFERNELASKLGGKGILQSLMGVSATTISKWMKPDGAEPSAFNLERLRRLAQQAEEKLGE